MSQAMTTVYMSTFAVPAASGPSATGPAGNAFANASNRRNVVPPSKSLSWVSVSVQVASSQAGRAMRVSTATTAVAGALRVNVTSGSAVADRDAFAVRIHCAPSSAGGTLATVKVRSPYMTTPGWRFGWTDQFAALAGSA